MAQLFPLWAYTACRSLNYLAHIILFLADTPKIKKKFCGCQFPSLKSPLINDSSVANL